MNSGKENSGLVLWLNQGAMLLVSVVIALGVGEAALRLKNQNMKNYDVEMWRYAKELKVRSEDPVLGHEHLKSQHALLQSVDIRTNEWGLRGGPVGPRQPDVRRILFLGSSITLGWGVEESRTLTALLQKKFEDAGQKVEVLNAGIGNYNSERYVRLFLSRLKDLQPSDIVVHYFLRDAEKLARGNEGFFLRHSELAVLLWNTWQHTIHPTGESSITDHYRQIYDPNYEGYRSMHAALTELSTYAHNHGIRLYLAITPDIRDLVDYKFGYVHEQVKHIAQDLGFDFVDLFPALKGLTPSEIYSMPGDPHPNALGHSRMADALFPALSRPSATPAPREVAGRPNAPEVVLKR